MNKKDYTWYKIGESELIAQNFLKPNHVKSITVEGNKYCLGKLGETYYALKDKCPHAGGSLGAGRCDTHGNVLCSYHMIAFDLKTGKNTSGEGYYTPNYPILTKENTLYIGIEKRNWFEFWK